MAVQAPPIEAGEGGIEALGQFQVAGVVAGEPMGAGQSSRDIGYRGRGQPLSPSPLAHEAGDIGVTDTENPRERQQSHERRVHILPGVADRNGSEHLSIYGGIFHGLP